MMIQRWGCLQEESDTKIIVHVKHCLLSGFRNIVIKTVDTDVLTLILARLSMFDQPYEIEVDFNFCKDRKFYNINKISSQITDQQRLGFFFYVFTGCDVTSSFFNCMVEIVVRKYICDRNLHKIKLDTTPSRSNGFVPSRKICMCCV